MGLNALCKENGSEIFQPEPKKIYYLSIYLITERKKNTLNTLMNKKKGKKPKQTRQFSDQLWWYTPLL